MLPPPAPPPIAPDPRLAELPGLPPLIDDVGEAACLPCELPLPSPLRWPPPSRFFKLFLPSVGLRTPSADALPFPLLAFSLSLSATTAASSACVRRSSDGRRELGADEGMMVPSGEADCMVADGHWVALMMSEPLMPRGRPVTVVLEGGTISSGGPKRTTGCDDPLVPIVGEAGPGVPAALEGEEEAPDADAVVLLSVASRRCRMERPCGPAAMRD